MDLIKKIHNRVRLTFEDGMKLYELDLFTLGKLASQKREALHQKKTYFNINRHINPTNECEDVCKFCSFSASRKNPNPYTMDIDTIVATAKKAVKNGADELHVVSAHNSQRGLSWYFDIFKAIKKECEGVHLKAMTAAEVEFLSRKFDKSFEQILDLMVSSGVDSMPGGGAEIFDQTVRNTICKGKVSATDWLKIHQLWHKRGKKSNATMLFGHIESRKDRIDHILQIRNTQDLSGGFNCFIPLVYQIQNNYLKVKSPATGVEILKTIAVSRLLLDNIAHIKSYWVTATINLATVAQEFGANDIDGTIEKESISSAAGAQSGRGTKASELISLIKNSGFQPIRRDSLYNELEVF